MNEKLKQEMISAYTRSINIIDEKLEDIGVPCDKELSQSAYAKIAHAKAEEREYLRKKKSALEKKLEELENE